MSDTTPIPAGTSDDTTVVTPAAAPAVEPVVEGQPPVAPVPAEPSKEGEEDQATLDKRLKGAVKEVQMANEDVARAVEVQATLVQENPELIHKIHSADVRMANRIIEKLWGQHGIKTYKHLQERIELETLKEKDPSAYESKKEVSELKQRLEVREEKDRKIALARFLEEKGVKNNEYDPSYKKVHEALSMVNPSIVAEDYERALRLAHTIAFGGNAPQGSYEPDSVQYSGTPANLPNQKAVHSEQTNFLAGAFRKQGFKINL